MVTAEREDLRVVPTMIASSLSGVLARFPCHPIDTVKARMQTQTWQLSGVSSSGVVYRNFAVGLRSIWRKEGLRGLYRGFGPTALGSMPASCLFFTTYELTKSSLHGAENEGRSSFFVHFAGGMAAETLSCVLWVPIDVIKERMQIQEIPRAKGIVELKRAGGDAFYSNGIDAVRSILRTEGVLGLYRGYGATVMSFGPCSALYFVFYEQIKRAIESTWYNRELKGDTYVTRMPAGALLFAGALAGSAASFFTNPLDLVKLRMQVQRHVVAASLSHGPGNSKPAAASEDLYHNMLDGLCKLHAREGLRGMMRGVGARMAFHAPSTAINMALFEKLKGITYLFV